MVSVGMLWPVSWHADVDLGRQASPPPREVPPLVSGFRVDHCIRLPLTHPRHRAAVFSP